MATRNKPSRGVVDLAYAVARGDRKLTEFPAPVQRRIKHVMDAYGDEDLKGYATHQPVRAPIGSRLSVLRKVHSR